MKHCNRLNRIDVRRREGVSLSADRHKLKELIKEQVENERKAVKLLRDSTKSTRNAVIRLLLHQLALDSIKHEHMLNAALQLIESSSKEHFRKESEEFRQAIEEHVEMERKMLEDFESIVDKTGDKRIRFILQEIISDEKKHHAITQRMFELACESEETKDEKWWDFLFRYSRLSG